MTKVCRFCGMKFDPNARKESNSGEAQMGSVHVEYTMSGDMCDGCAAVLRKGMTGKAKRATRRKGNNAL